MQTRSSSHTICRVVIEPGAGTPAPVPVPPGKPHPAQTDEYAYQIRSKASILPYGHLVQCCKCREKVLDAISCRIQRSLCLLLRVRSQVRQGLTSERSMERSVPSGSTPPSYTPHCKATT